MFVPIERQMPWKTEVEPVKWTPPRRPSAMTGSPTVPPLPGTKLMTPSGTPASWNIFIR